MFAPVELPFWIVAAGTLLAAVAVLDRLLIPSVRWYLRKRVMQVIDDLNDRLELKIRPFKLTRRADLIDRLMHDPQVMEAVFEHAREESVPLAVATERALAYAKETVPSFSAFAYFSLGTRLAKWVSEALYRVRVGRSDDAALAKIDPEATVVFVINHRSNMDYVLVTYLAASRSALSYAVGEWARVWPLQTLIRSMGAYFIRRKSRNTLYRRVLARYVQLATEGGVTQAVFLEGGLSRDGTLGDPKLGILSYIMTDFDPSRSRDVVFVPVGLNYDRVLEDRMLIAAAGKENARFRMGLGTALGFVLRHIWLRLRGRFHRYGYACVSFGTPLSLRRFLTETVPEAEPGDEVVSDLGAVLTTRIAEIVPVLPVPLIASLMIENQEMPQSAILEQAEDLYAKLGAAGAHRHVPRGDMAYAVEFGLRALSERHILSVDDGIYRIMPGQEGVLQYYANSIGQFLDQG